MSKWALMFSGGKDSTAMLHVVLREKMPLDDIACYVSEWDFSEVEAHLRQVEATARVTIRRIRHPVSRWTMLQKWGWPHWQRRWCTGQSAVALNGATVGAAKYIGIAADEKPRAQKYKPDKTGVARFPLVEHGMTGGAAMTMCRTMGYTWGGLYDIYPRLSCYCCPFQRWATLDLLRIHHPRLYAETLRQHAALPDKLRELGWKHGRGPEHGPQSRTVRDHERKQKRTYFYRKRLDPGWLDRERKRQREWIRAKRARKKVLPELHPPYRPSSAW